MMMAGVPPAIGHIKANRLRAVGVSTARRSPVLPEVPTIAEGGVPGYEYITWYPVLAPSAVPKPVLAKLSHATAKAVASADVRDKLAQQGVDAESSTPGEVSALLKREIARWTKIIKAAGIRPE